MLRIGSQHKTTFREVVGRGLTFTPCVWDCYSAKAAEMAGFDAMLLSGASLGFSLAGVPVVSIPCKPGGMQLAAGRGCDERLLQLASQIGAQRKAVLKTLA